MNGKGNGHSEKSHETFDKQQAPPCVVRSDGHIFDDVGALGDLAMAKPEGFGLPAFLRDPLQSFPNAGAVGARRFEGGPKSADSGDKRCPKHGQRGNNCGPDAPCPCFQKQGHHPGADAGEHKGNKAHARFRH